MSGRRVAAGHAASRAAVVLSMTLLVFGVVGPLATAGAQGETPPAPTTTLVPVDDQPQPRSPSIIPTPNSGDGVVDDGDPGSAAQYAVLGLTVAGMAAVVLLIRRESNRKRDQRTPLPD